MLLGDEVAVYVFDDITAFNHSAQNLGCTLIVVCLGLKLLDTRHHLLVLTELVLDGVFLDPCFLAFSEDFGFGSASLGSNLEHVSANSLRKLYRHKMMIR